MFRTFRASLAFKLGDYEPSEVLYRCSFSHDRTLYLTVGGLIQLGPIAICFPCPSDHIPRQKCRATLNHSVRSGTTGNCRTTNHSGVTGDRKFMIIGRDFGSQGTPKTPRATRISRVAQSKYSGATCSTEQCLCPVLSAYCLDSARSGLGPMPLLLAWALLSQLCRQNGPGGQKTVGY